MASNQLNDFVQATTGIKPTSETAASPLTAWLQPNASPWGPQQAGTPVGTPTPGVTPTATPAGGGGGAAAPFTWSNGGYDPGARLTNEAYLAQQAGKPAVPLTVPTSSADAWAQAWNASSNNPSAIAPPMAGYYPGTYIPLPPGANPTLFGGNTGWQSTAGAVLRPGWAQTGTGPGGMQNWAGPGGTAQYNPNNESFRVSSDPRAYPGAGTPMYPGTNIPSINPYTGIAPQGRQPTSPNWAAPSEMTVGGGINNPEWTRGWDSLMAYLTTRPLYNSVRQTDAANAWQPAAGAELQQGWSQTGTAPSGIQTWEGPGGKAEYNPDSQTYRMF